MAKTSTNPKAIRPGLLHKLSLSQEKARFEQYLEYCRPTGEVFKYAFLAGMAKGFGVVIGTTLVASLVVSVLGLLGAWLPGDLGSFVRELNHDLIEAAK